MKIWILSREQTSTVDARNLACISLFTPSYTYDKPIHTKPWAMFFQLGIDDVEYHVNEDYRVFDELDAFNIIQFLESVFESTIIEGLVIHCDAGVSRSAAIGKFIKETYEGHRIKFANGDKLANRLVYEKLRNLSRTGDYYENR